MKYLKVMFGNVSGADKGLEYKINEVNIADKWNPNANTPEEMGGFNYSNEENILRWLIRGDTLYDVLIPDNAEVIKVDNPSTPDGVFRSNKIILSNPREVTDEIALDLYRKSKMPEKTYYKALAGLAIRGYKNTCIELIKDKINKENIDLVLSEFNDFVNSKNSSGTASNGNEVYEEVMTWLNEIKSNLLISRFIDKDIYSKVLTSDRVINITGESGSGKSYYSKKYMNDDNYVVIDTDVVFGNAKANNKYEEELHNKVLTKFGSDNSILCTNFDECYLFMLECLKDVDKTVVIDSAQYRNVKDVNILKGEIIIVRTSIETCYQRCINRYKERYSDASTEEIEKYSNKKRAVFKWYYAINRLLERLEKI